MTLKIFAFGPMGSGKDAFADYMAERHGFGSVALADGIRDFIIARNPSYVPKSNRALEIEVGEKHREWFGVDYWCKVAENRIRTDLMLKWRAGVIVRDGRFRHEYEHFVEERGYIPVYIAADGLARYERLLQRDGAVNIDQFRDPRDCEIAHYPAEVVANNGTLAEFYAEIDRFVARLKAVREEVSLWN